MRDHTQDRWFEHIGKSIRYVFSGSKLTRTSESIQIDIMDNTGVVVLLTPEHIEIRLRAEDKKSSRLWKRCELDGLWDGKSAGVSPELTDLIINAIKERAEKS